MLIPALGRYLLTKAQASAVEHKTCNHKAQMSSRLSLTRSRMEDIIGDIGRDRDVQMVSLYYSYAHLTNTVINITMSLK